MVPRGRTVRQAAVSLQVARDAHQADPAETQETKETMRNGFASEMDMSRLTHELGRVGLDPMKG